MTETVRRYSSAPPTQPDATAALSLMGLRAVDPVRAAAVAVQLGALLTWLSEGARQLTVWDNGNGWNVLLWDDGEQFLANKQDVFDALGHALVMAQAAEASELEAAE